MQVRIIDRSDDGGRWAVRKARGSSPIVTTRLKEEQSNEGSWSCEPLLEEVNSESTAVTDDSRRFERSRRSCLTRSGSRRHLAGRCT